MSTLRSKDRASLCSFTFADGRQCRTPRFSGHPRLCCFHARKEAQAQAADSLGPDISYRFSGSYLSACDPPSPRPRSSPSRRQITCFRINTYEKTPGGGGVGSAPTCGLRSCDSD